MLRPLTESILVAPQIGIETVQQAKALGVTLIVNNRPEGESPDQIAGEEIEAAARAAGIDYVAIPVTHSGFAPWQLDALDAALASNPEGKTLCYCRSGTRSTLLWSLARARAGDSPDALAETA
ncbi:MAG: TIGR01244 family phosphatase, partial [Sphingomonadales bacterium]|nr:TIGR01244 family phosphatase [Sphingomonadales bacterium]